MSFFKKTDNEENNCIHDNSKSLEISSAERAEDRKSLCLDNFSSFDRDSIKLDQYNSPPEIQHKIAIEKNGISLPVSMGHMNSKSASSNDDEIILIRREGIKEKVRLMKSKLKRKNNNSSLEQASAIKIQS